MPRVVGWYWTAKGCHQHYVKNVWQWCYDDAAQQHVHVNLGNMVMDDFGQLVKAGV